MKAKKMYVTYNLESLGLKMVLRLFLFFYRNITDLKCLNNIVKWVNE